MNLPRWPFIAGLAAAGVTLAVTRPKVRQKFLDGLRSLGTNGCPLPTEDMQRAIASWAAHYAIPVWIPLAVMRQESCFDAQAFRAEPANFERWESRLIPGSQVTWGQVYPVEQWGSYGLGQLMPYRAVAVPGGLSVGQPLDLLYDIDRNARLTCRLLAELRQKHGNWQDAFCDYNSGQPCRSAPQVTYITYLDRVTRNIAAMVG